MTSSPETSRKRVNFPWLKFNTSKRVKAYMAYLFDKLNATNSIGKRDRKKIFISKIFPRINKKYPKLYLLIHKYYGKRGRVLTKEDYSSLLYMRLVCMYDTNLKKSSEHPLNDDKLRKIYHEFKIAEKSVPSTKPSKR